MNRLLRHIESLRAAYQHHHFSADSSKYNKWQPINGLKARIEQRVDELHDSRENSELNTIARGVDGLNSFNKQWVIDLLTQGDVNENITTIRQQGMEIHELKQQFANNRLEGGGENDTIQIHHAQLRQSAEKQKQIIEQLTKTLRERDDAVGQLENGIKKIEQTKNNLQSRLEKNRKEYKKLESSYRELKVQLNKQTKWENDTFEKYKKKYESRIQTLNIQINDLQSDLAKYKSWKTKYEKLANENNKRGGISGYIGSIFGGGSNDNNDDNNDDSSSSSGIASTLEKNRKEEEERKKEAKRAANKKYREKQKQKTTQIESSDDDENDS